MYLCVCAQCMHVYAYQRVIMHVCVY
jgi:hypothetical protein